MWYKRKNLGLHPHDPVLSFFGILFWNYFILDTPNDSLSNTESEDGQDLDTPLGTGCDAPQAYAFEPIRLAGLQVSDESEYSDDCDDDNEISSSDAENDERLHNLAWCQCGNCSNQTLGSVTVRECVCCQEIPPFAPRIQVDDYPEDLKCITHNPHFFIICLDIEVLDVALLSMADVKAETLV